MCAYYAGTRPQPRMLHLILLLLFLLLVELQAAVADSSPCHHGPAFLVRPRLQPSTRHQLYLQRHHQHWRRAAAAFSQEDDGEVSWGEELSPSADTRSSGTSTATIAAAVARRPPTSSPSSPSMLPISPATASGTTSTTSCYRSSSNGNGDDTAVEEPLGPYALAMIDEICLETVESLLGLGLGRSAGGTGDASASSTEWLVRKGQWQAGGRLIEEASLLACLDACVHMHELSLMACPSIHPTHPCAHSSAARRARAGEQGPDAGGEALLGRDEPAGPAGVPGR